LIADQSSHTFAAANTALITATTNLDRITSELRAIESERARCQTTDLDTRRLERVAALAKGDNERNTSFENWVLAAHLRDVVELANIRLARSTHQRFQLCVLDDGENKRGTWGLDLGVEDTVTGTQRPTAGLSGGELFQASLALALGLADAVMNQSAGVRVDALFIDEGFGSLDETSVERAIDLLDELRDRGAMVGVITHVPALLEALPLGVSVIESPNGQGSTIRQTTRAA
jgi:exonuclease SbcC